MITAQFLHPLAAPQRHVVAAAAGLAAAAHIPVIGPHLQEAPYMGVLFIIFTILCLALGSAVLVWDAPVVYLTAAATCGLAILGYSATRLIAFPLLSDDVGNWLEPLGVVSVVTEAVVVAACTSALLHGVSEVRHSRLSLVAKLDPDWR
jgi:hypothetical protein